MYEMYRLMAIAKYDERYVIPTAHVEQAHELEEIGCSLDFDERSGHVRVRPVRRGQRSAGRRWRSRPSTRCKQRQTSDAPAGDERAARPGQPAQLGRQRRPRRACSPSDARRSGRRAVRPRATADATGSSTRRRRWCLDYPDRRAASTGCRAAPGGAGRAAAAPTVRTLRRARSTTSATTAARRPAARTTSRCSTSPASTRSTCRTGPTATPAAAARCSAGSSGATAPAASSSTPHGELPDYLPMVLEFAARRRPGRRRRSCCRSTGPASSCCGSRWSRTQTPVRRRASRPCARRCPARRRRTGAAVHGDGRRRPPDRDRRPRAVRPAAAAAQPAGGTPMNVLLWGVLPYLVLVAPGRRHDLALPLRQVRLDHALLAALRVAAAADRLAAVPLRHPGGAHRPHRRPGHPRVLDRGGRDHRGPVPLQRAALRRHRRASAPWPASSS